MLACIATNEARVFTSIHSFVHLVLFLFSLFIPWSSLASFGTLHAWWRIIGMGKRGVVALRSPLFVFETHPESNCREWEGIRREGRRGLGMVKRRLGGLIHRTTAGSRDG